MPVLLAHAVEDSTDIFGISGGGDLNTPPWYATACSQQNSGPTKYHAVGGAQTFCTQPRLIATLLSHLWIIKVLSDSDMQEAVYSGLGSSPWSSFADVLC